MKLRLISCLMVSMLAGVLHAADTTTTRMGLVKPEEDSSGWGEKIRDNYDILDSSVAILSSTQTFTGGSTFSSATITALRTDQIIVSSPSYGGVASIYTDGAVHIGAYINLGESGQLGAPYINFINNDPLGASAQIFHSGNTNSSLVLRGTLGAYVNTINNAPAQIGVKRILAGPSYYSYATPYFEPSDSSDSSFEYAVLIGTTTNDSVSKLLVLSSQTYSYSVAIGTVSTNNTPQYHLTVSTSGISTFGGRARLKSYTLAQIQALTNPVPVAGDTVYCSDCTTDAVCVSTAGVNSFVRTSARSTVCQ